MGPVGGELGCDPRQRGAESLLILVTGRVLQPEVGHECERPAAHERVGDLPPTHIRIDPMNLRCQKHGSVVRVRQRRLLQARVDELHLTGAVQLIARPRDQLLARLDRRNPQAPRQQAARQLACAAADLQHTGSGSEARHRLKPSARRPERRRRGECRGAVADRRRRASFAGTTRRRNRTFQAGGCPALPVLKFQRRE
jgi:hypothetical protein